MKLPWVNNVFHSYSLTQNTNLFLHFLPRDRSQTSGRSTIVECTALCRRTENKTNWQPLKELGHDNDLEVAHPQSGSLSTWFLVELEFENVGFWGEGKSRVHGEKPLGAKERSNKNLNSHYGTDAGIWTRATLVGGERSHHCAILFSACKPTQHLLFLHVLACCWELLHKVWNQSNFCASNSQHVFCFVIAEA